MQKSARIINANIVFVFLGIIFAFPQIANGEDNPLLPAWFWDTPRMEGVRLAVGYSMPYRAGPSANEIAFLDGAWRLFTDKYSHVAGERADATWAEETMGMGSTVRQEVDSSGFHNFLQTIFHIDSASTPSMRVMLVGTAQVEVDRRMMASPADNQTHSTNSSHFAAGAAPRYYFESSSWDEAERVARIELAFNACTKLKSLEYIIDGNIVRTVVQMTDVILTDVQTVRRRIDYDEGFTRVWVSGKAYKRNR